MEDTSLHQSISEVYWCIKDLQKCCKPVRSLSLQPAAVSLSKPQNLSFSAQTAQMRVSATEPKGKYKCARLYEAPECD